MERNATIVVDLGFGDAGKGTIIDFLARKAHNPTVVRFNGGGQAAHNVITSDGRHHTFAQFGSGTFAGARTHLSRFMLIDLVSMANEVEHLASIGCGDVFSRLTVDEDALVVTPFQKAANRLREISRGGGKHGSCGMGIGETMADMIAFPDWAVRARDLRAPEVLERKLVFFQEMKREEFRHQLDDLAQNPFGKKEAEMLLSPDAPRECAEALWRIAMRFTIVPGAYLKILAKEGDLLFEGAQGVLLDEWHGFHPYTTWSTTTPANALELLSEIGFDGSVERLGVLRAYFTRHGVGPFVTMDRELTRLLPDPFNRRGPWQGFFRTGWFDLVMARYAVTVSGGFDSLAITNLDRFARIPQPRIATAYHVPKDVLVYKGKTIASARSDGAREKVERLYRKEELRDLRYQEALTRLLEASVPEYRPAPEGEGYLQMIEKDLMVPISITSHGPTAIDKHLRMKFAKVA
jgi:adenylosuccinate synthase